MRRDFGLIFHFFLVLGDACAILLSFLVAYLIRIHLDQRPFYFKAEPLDFVLSILVLLPVYLVVLAAFGLYSKSIFLKHSRWSEFGRLFLASVVGMMAIISYDFFFHVDLFPVRIMVLYAVLTCFLSLCLFRGLIRLIRSHTFKTRKVTLRAVIIGNSKNTEYLANYISAFPESGFSLAGVVAGAKFIPKDLRRKQYSSLKEALRRTKPDVIFQCRSRAPRIHK